MAIVYDQLLALKIPDVEHSYGPKDCLLYALGVGLEGVEAGAGRPVRACGAQGVTAAATRVGENG